MEFEFKYTMSADDLIALNKIRNNILYRKRNKILKAVYALLGVLFFGLGLTIVQQGSIAAGVFISVVGVFFLVHLYTVGRLSWRRAEKLAAGGAGEQTVRLEEDGVRVKDSTAQGFVPYGEFSDLCYMEGWYCLVFGVTHTLLIPEKAMIRGDPARLRAFLEVCLERETIDLA